MSEQEKENTPKVEEDPQKEEAANSSKVEEEPKKEELQKEEPDNNLKIEEEPKKEEPIPEPQPEIKISPNIYQEIISLKEKNIYLFTEYFEEKIPEILSYLLESGNEFPIANKIQILLYLKDLFNKVEFYPEIFLKKKTLKEKINIFEVIINQYIITNSEKEKDYLSELKNMFIFLLSKISLDKKTYKYIFSFLVNYLNNKKPEQKLTSDNISKILDLLIIYYTTLPQLKDKFDYIYFNDINTEDKNNDYLLKIQNKENIFNPTLKKILYLEDTLNILLFIKLIPKEIIKTVQPDFNMGLLELDFVDKNKNISFNIDNEYNLVYNNDTKEKISKLEENKFINILFRFSLKDTFKIDIYINTKKIEFKNSEYELKENEKTKAKENNKFEINSIKLFKNFVGQCSNIILFKRKIEEGLSKFFTKKQSVEVKQKPKANTISALFDVGKQEKIFREEIVIQENFIRGLNNENLINILLKHELKDDIDQTSLNNLIKNKKEDKTPLNDIREFYEKIISLYTASRNEITNYEIILKDSISGLDAIFKNKNNLNGIHICNNSYEDFNDIGGLNHLIPIIELMINNSSNDNDLLTSENIITFFNLIITLLVPYYDSYFKNEKNSLFFSYLLNFLIKIPEKYFISEIVDNIIILSNIFLEQLLRDDYGDSNQDFQSYILFDEKLFYKYKYEDQKKIMDQINSVLMLFYSKKIEFVNIDIMKIINIMLYYDKEKYSKFCCKEHSDYFNHENKEKKIMEPELFEVIKPLEYILKLFFKKYKDEPMKDTKSGNQNELSKLGNDILSLFEILTMDISPCLQRSIIKIFYEFFEENIDQAFKYVNLLDKNSIVFEVCLFALKSSVFEYKVDVLNFINLLIKIKNNLNAKNKSKDKENLASVKITGPYKVLMNNNILPFYLIPKDELNNVDESKIIKLFYGMGGIEYNYISKTESERKIYLNYNKKKINALILELYDNLFKSFKSNPTIPINLEFLVKIASKGDLNLIEKFMKDLIKEKNNIEEINKSNLIMNYVLETYFQIFMIKATNYDKNKFISRFHYLNENENDMKKKIEEIIKLCESLIIEIFIKNIYKIDYLLTWAKYYYEICKNKSKITKELFEDFIYNIISKLDKNKFKNEIVIYESPEPLLESVYFINIIFELVTYFKLSFINEENKDKLVLISDKGINNELYSSFDSILVNKSNIPQQNVSNKTKWKYYIYFKKIFSYFNPLWNKVMKDENEIAKYLENKKNINIYLPEFEILFTELNKVDYISPLFDKQNTTNRGMKLIYILYHYFIQLFNLGGDRNDIHEILTTYRSFLTLLIISSCTLSTNIDKKRQKWPKPDDYKNAQIIVKNILYYSFKFFDKTIRKYEDIKISNDADKNYFSYVKNMLYTTFAYLLRLTNMIYRQTRKEEDKKAKKTGVKLIISKVKNLITEGEGVKTSGLYSLYEKMYNILDLEFEFDKKNYLDNIPNISFAVSEKPINNKIIECIKKFMDNAKSKRFFELTDTINNDEDIDRTKFYPFVEYIKKRNSSLSSFIPLYDVLPNVEFDTNEEKNHILKKLYLVCDYFQKCPYEKELEKNIKKINDEVNQKLLLNIKKGDMEKRTKLLNYIKEKKKLFSFLNIWSDEEYFYNKEKYEIKYKLINHLTNDFTKVLFKPIINLDYYFPQFTKYNYDQIFRNVTNRDTICNIADLSDVVPQHKKPLIEDKEDDDDDENKKDDNKDKNENKENKEKENNDLTPNYNELYDIKLNYFKDLENIITNKDLTELKVSPELFKEYIINKYSTTPTQHDTKVEACLINAAIHITGLFFNDQKGIGFYSYEKNHSNEIYEENYDQERFTCFGSIFRPNNNKYKDYYIRIPYNSIELILKRRYFYKRSALEIFTTDKKSYFFNINEDKYKTLYDNIKYYMKSTIEEINIEYSKYDDKIGFYNKRTFLKLNKGFIPLENKLKDMSLKPLYESWSKWKISSLKLLMLLNLYGSRTFHDLNQYPVFPWIITDYESPELPKLNNTDSNIVRPLNTPMGMMDFIPEAKERKESYIDTWNSAAKNEDEDEDEEENGDRYRSHYSTSLYATYYLVRVFPYSYIRVELQGKNFDDPNRLFNSLKSSFYNAISQKSDIRELIPECFYLPEIFYNYNKLNLGVLNTERGEKLCEDVDIPKWAKGNGYIFIGKHKEILESAEISEKINEWFDIIFGSKQNGKEARNINNLFVRESYEEYEKHYREADKDKKTYLCKIIEFGVTPSQLFKGNTNKRMPYSDLKNNKQLLPNTSEYLRNIENNNDMIKDLIIDEAKFHIKEMPYKLCYSEGIKGKYRISVITPEKIKFFKRIFNRIQINKSVPLKPNAKTNIPTENKEDEKEIMELDIEPKKEIKLISNKNRINNAPVVTYNNGKIFVFGGYYNGMLLLQNTDENIEEKKIKTNNNVMYVTNDNSPITKIVISKDDTYAICGNSLGKIYIYIINQNNKLEWTLYKKLTEHRDEITALDINEDLNMFISCSKDGYWNSYTLPDCSLINSFRFTENIFTNEKYKNNRIYYPNIALTIYSPLPCVVFYFEERKSLCLFSINGKLIKEELEFKISENGIKKYKDMQFNEYLLIYNESKFCIEIYDVLELKSVISLPLIEHNFVDFVVGKEMDHISVLVKFRSKNDEKNNDAINVKTSYKILVIRNNNLEFDWK